MSLYRLLYRSDIAMTGPDVDDRIDEIVRTSAGANADVGLSGALVASGGVFIQALEGPLPALEAKFEKICCDLRHRHVQLIELAATEDKTFSEWPMVRVSHAADMAELMAFCGIVGSRQPMRLDMSTTSALICLMRSMLLTQAKPSLEAGSRSAVHGRHDRLSQAGLNETVS